MKNKIRDTIEASLVDVLCGGHIGSQGKEYYSKYYNTSESVYAKISKRKEYTKNNRNLVYKLLLFGHDYTKTKNREYCLFECINAAESNYSITRVGKMYEEYFSMLLDLYREGGGWYSLKRNRTEMDWLKKEYK